MQAHRDWKAVFQGMFSASAKKSRAKALKRDPKSPPRKFTIEGSLQPGTNSDYAINGEDIVVDEETWIFGDLEFGSQAVVSGTVGVFNEKQARKIVLK